jgi:leucyl-tRNA synthetase
MKYNHQKIEKKWQKIWEEKGIYQAKDNSKKKKFYSLVEFPYPSGEGLHTGHARSYTAMDIVSRKKRMEGYNVLYPMGWDAFGLPTENYAIKHKIDPHIITKRNTDNYRKQLKSLGLSFDWRREINTSNSEYYKWTQWMFIKFWENGLANKEKTMINWCPSCKIGLANEEVVNGKCERCEKETTKKEKEQWMIKITQYAEELLGGLNEVDYSEKVKTLQRNWIGKSEGSTIKFSIFNDNQVKIDEIEVFTTRADTLFGATFLVLSPESEKLKNLMEEIYNKEEVRRYIKEAEKISEIERISEKKEKTGIKIRGIYAENPASKKRIPLFTADYVLSHYGSGAIMAVPAHDERDEHFAKKFDLEIIPVIEEYEEEEMEGKREKTTILIIHGFTGHSKGDWFPWLKREFTRKGFNVLIPDLPNSDKPELDEWLNALKNLKSKFDEKLIIIGHSLGAITACKFIDDNDIKLEKLILVAPTGKSQKYEELLKKDFDEEEVDIIKKFNQTDINWGKVKKLAKEKLLYFSTNDPYIQLNIKDDYADLEGKVKIFENKGHFNEDSGILELPEIIEDIENYTNQETKENQNENNEIYQGEGILINSDSFNGLDSKIAREKITLFVGGKKTINYKLRDWVFSRQRYWGEPIPMVKCQKCGWQPVNEKELPVKLPKIKNYQPTESGESPLASNRKWVETKCPKCKGKAERETDTMPNWAGSSWYFLRYTDSKNKKRFADKKKLSYWMPVDWYNGGMEHTTLHLLYSRFWNRFLYNIKELNFKEPYKKRTSHGMILAEGGVKMSKSKGNVINPDDIVKQYGADTLRIYEMFMGPFEQAIAWDSKNILGARRFLEKVWRISEEKQISKKTKTSNNLKLQIEETCLKVSEDIENMKFNTAISSLMTIFNEIEKDDVISKKDFEKILIILSPFAPHITEEVWQQLKNRSSIHLQKWVKVKKKIEKKEFNLIIQINGRIKEKIKVKTNISQEKAEEISLKNEKIQKNILNKKIKKVVFIPNRLINFVV